MGQSGGEDERREGEGKEEEKRTERKGEKKETRNFPPLSSPGNGLHHITALIPHPF